MFYNVDFGVLAQMLTPTFLRKGLLLVMLNAIGLVLNSLHYRFLQQRARHIYLTEHNGQVCYLEKALNDRFDSTNRGFYITDGDYIEGDFLYTNFENNPTYLPEFINLSQELVNSAFDFIVIVPNTINIELQQYEIKALIDTYKLASKTYKIQYE